MQTVNNRKDAAKALLAKLNEKHSRTMFYKCNLGDWQFADMQELYKTTARARKADGISYDNMIENATVNAFGYVFVNGVNCGHLG